MGKTWVVKLNIVGEYQLTFTSKGIYKEFVWMLAPNHLSYPKETVFAYVKGLVIHFEAEDTFDIDDQKSLRFNNLVTYLKENYFKLS